MSKTVPTTENHQAPSISGAEDEKLPHVIQGIVGGVFMVLRIKITEVNCHFHHIRSRADSINMIYHC